MPVIKLGEEVSIVVSYKKTIFASDNFFIISVSAPNIQEKFPTVYEGAMVEFVAKGRFAPPDYKGQTIELVGEWIYDTKRKEYSLSVHYTIPSLPLSRDDSVCFLRTIRGIGEKLAIRVCDEYHDNLESATLDEDALVASVKGMSASKASSLCGAIRRINASAELTRLLRNMVPGDIIRKIAVKYGSNAIDVVNQTPYKMVQDRVVLFKDADLIALSLGCDKLSEERITAGIISNMRALKNRSAAIIVEKDSLHKSVIQTLCVDESIINEQMNALYKKRVIVSAGKYCYLYDDFVTERDLADKIVQYCNEKVFSDDAASYLSKFNDWKKQHTDIQLAENQEKAVCAVATNFLSVVTGGPGTGKTATLKAIMETYKMAFPNGNITLMAPTGLASKRMANACSKEAKTIHSTLGLTPSDGDVGFNDTNGLSIDGGLVIIDEFSMVGIHLSKFLFDAVVFKKDVRVVIVGDVDQLPPVSAGAVLDDLITCGCVKVTRLNRNFRQEVGSASIDGAYAINAGNTNLVFSGNFQFKEVSNNDIENETQTILEEVKTAFVESISKYGLDQTYVLAPQRNAEIKDGIVSTKTLLSTTSLNPILRDIVNPAAPGKAFCKNGSHVFRVGDRVVNTKGTREVPNGEIGIIKRIETVDMTTIVVDFDDIEVEYTPDIFKRLELAYSLSVHKSQGCEYDSVIIPASMTQGCLLQRELLYTAVTRAKENVLIIGSREAVNKFILTVKNKSKRDLLAARIARKIILGKGESPVQASA